MIALLSRFFIKNRENPSSPKVRQAYGMLCGIVGIALNLLLFAGKFLAGSLSSSIAVTADAFNNLSDAGSSVITLVGFQMAGQKPDPDHPFGHGRIEYLSGLFVSIAILFMAFELVRSSVYKILEPEPVEFNPVSAGILLASIAVKLYMSAYNRGIGRKIGSAALRAAATDSLSDALATTVVFLSLLIGHFANLQIDGYCGVLVGLFIFYAGYSAAKDTITPLLGQAPDADFVKNVRETVLGYEGVKGIHDMVVHDYGPGRVMLSLHAEVAADGDILKLHDMIDNIEQQLREELHCEAVIHMDPIVTNDRQTNELKHKVDGLLKAAYPEVQFHDFRIVAGPSHTNILFDITVPFGYPTSDKEITDYLTGEIQRMDGRFFAVIQVDRDFTASSR